jgi:hypothetical protein
VNYKSIILCPSVGICEVDCDFICKCIRRVVHVAIYLGMIPYSLHYVKTRKDFYPLRYTINRSVCFLPAALKSVCETGCIYRQTVLSHLACRLSEKSTYCVAPCDPSHCPGIGGVSSKESTSAVMIRNNALRPTFDRRRTQTEASPSCSSITSISMEERIKEFG